MRKGVWRIDGNSANADDGIVVWATTARAVCSSLTIDFMKPRVTMQ